MDTRECQSSIGKIPFRTGRFADWELEERAGDALRQDHVDEDFECNPKQKRTEPLDDERVE